MVDAVTAFQAPLLVSLEIEAAFAGRVVLGFTHRPCEILDERFRDVRTRRAKMKRQ